MRNTIFVYFVLFSGIRGYSNSCITQTCVEQTYLSQVGVKEKSGKNDGVDVEMYLKAVGLGREYSWCAAFVRWCFDQCGVKTTINAWSPTAENTKNIVFKGRQWQKEPRSGDVLTLWSLKLGRINHTGFIHRLRDSKTVETVEGNTSGTSVVSGSVSDVNGDGVYRKIRPLYSIHSISRWE